MNSLSIWLKRLAKFIRLPIITLISIFSSKSSDFTSLSSLISSLLLILQKKKRVYGCKSQAVRLLYLCCSFQSTLPIRCIWSSFNSPLFYRQCSDIGHTHSLQETQSRVCTHGVIPLIPYMGHREVNAHDESKRKSMLSFKSHKNHSNALHF